MFDLFLRNTTQTSVHGQQFSASQPLNEGIKLYGNSVVVNHRAEVLLVLVMFYLWAISNALLDL